MTAQVFHGDCMDVLAGMAANTIDAIVTDPPYEIGFMGKGWDGSGIAYRVELWAECLRVLKPGGHLLAFGGTRTYHRMTTAIDDAGFDVRDSLHWIYGSGFPKSLDVSKAIDKQRDDLPEVRNVCRWLRAAIDASPETVRSIAERFGFHPRMVEHWAARDTDSQPTVPKWDQWEQLRTLLNFGDGMDAEVWRLNGRKGQPGEAWAERVVTGQHEQPAAAQVWQNNVNGTGNLTPKERRDAPATDAARQWEGWGTALKPAHEPIVVARKPLTGTVAATVLTHGTGALNIDGCRVGYASDTDRSAMSAGVESIRERGGVVEGSWKNSSDLAGANPAHTAGRWPANLVLTHAHNCEQVEPGTSTSTPAEEVAGGIWAPSEGKPAGPTYSDTPAVWRCADGCPVAELDAQSGNRPGATGKTQHGSGTNSVYGTYTRTEASTGNMGTTDAGGASRFFTVTEWDPVADVAPFRYVAKPSKRERNAGVPDGTPGHPTVKPVALMQWLVRLVTPPGGVVLDPFAGSGTTLVAATLEGFHSIGIELTDDYHPIIAGRVAWAENEAAAPPDTLFDPRTAAT